MLCDTFCSSPWTGIRIDYEGDFTPCRFMWQYENNYQKNHRKYNINDVSMLEYWNSDEMTQLRSTVASGDVNNRCRNCFYDDSMGNHSGRKKSLHNSGININNFNNTLVSSPHYKHFLYSENNNGHTTLDPTDLQIDIGSVCNGACVMCSPYASSKLIPDFRKLSVDNPDVFYNPSIRRDWSRNSRVFDKFLQELGTLKKLKYIHLLGGETFYIERFYDVCNRLIETGQSQSAILGTTTNCTIYNQRIVDTLTKFDQVHLGLSIETFTPTNDYIRWPAKIKDITNNIDKFVELRNNDPDKFFLSLRFTPNMLSILEIDTVFEYMFKNNIVAEKCKIMTDPSWLSISCLPQHLIDTAIERVEAFVIKHNLTDTGTRSDNTRHKENIMQTNTDTVFEILNYLKTVVQPDDIDAQLDKCVRYLKGFEGLRKNSLYNHIPELATYLEKYGYAKDQ